jgi:hypothetical protein
MRAKSSENPSSSNLFLFFETSLCIKDADPLAGGSETRRPSGVVVWLLPIENEPVRAKRDCGLPPPLM